MSQFTNDNHVDDQFAALAELADIRGWGGPSDQGWYSIANHVSGGGRMSILGRAYPNGQLIVAVSVYFEYDPGELSDPNYAEQLAKLTVGDLVIAAERISGKAIHIED